MGTGKVGGTKVQAEEIVDGMFDAVVSTLKKGEKCQSPASESSP